MCKRLALLCVDIRICGVGGLKFRVCKKILLELSREGVAWLGRQ